MLPQFNPKGKESFIKRIEINKEKNIILVYYAHSEKKPEEKPYNTDTLNELNAEIMKQISQLSDCEHYNGIISNEILSPRNKLYSGLGIASSMFFLAGIGILGITGDISNALATLVPALAPHCINAFTFLRKEKRLREYIEVLTNLLGYTNAINKKIQEEEKEAVEIGSQLSMKEVFVTEKPPQAVEPEKETTSEQGTESKQNAAESEKEAHLGEIDDEYQQYFLEELNGDPRYLPLLVDYILMNTESADELKKLLQWLKCLAEQGKIPMPEIDINKNLALTPGQQ